jgi:hypothetical protein
MKLMPLFKKQILIFVFMYSLFIDAFSVIQNIACNNGMTSKLLIEEALKGSDRGLI